MRQYSKYFTTIYDETNTSADSLGRGTHYSIFRAEIRENVFFDFAIIWDEDHDKRIIEVLENIYKKNELHGYMIFGERKGGLTAIIANPDTFKNSKKLPGVVQISDGDYWRTTILTLKEVGNGSLITGEEKQIKKYIQKIISRWDLNGNLKILNEAFFQFDTVEKGKIMKHTAINEYKRNDMPMKRSVSMYSFQNSHIAKLKEITWQKSVCHRFFKLQSPLDKTKLSFQYYQIFEKYISNEEKNAITLDDMCRRSLIIALAKIMQKHQRMPMLEFKIGTTIIQLEPSQEESRNRQRGNFKMVLKNSQYDIAYGENCFRNILYLLKGSWESDSDPKIMKRKRKLLELIHNKLCVISSFRFDEFTKYGLIKLEEETAVNDYTEESIKKKIEQKIDFLNGLLFLVTTVEVAVRLYREKDGSIYNYPDSKAQKSDAIPVAIAQSRSLSLLMQNKITFNDFLGSTQKDDYDPEQHRAYYGLVTGKNTIDNINMVMEKLFAINKEHNFEVSARDAWKKFSETFLSENPKGYILEGRNRMYFDLTEIYGFGDESDGDYSDEEDNDARSAVAFAN